MASSPDSTQFLNDQQFGPDFTTPNFNPRYQQPRHMYDPRQQNQTQGQGMPRASFDQLNNTPRAAPSPRMVHSMYVQPSGANSNMSFGSGRFPGQQGQGQNGFVEGPGEKKGFKSGLKGFFGGAKAGRMA
jgi:hypothetical protein